jgi:hypothetical protein
MLEAYIDESYNSRTFCVGGWLAPVEKWSVIQKSWKQRVDFERSMSIKKGFRPISRYHASDCSSLKAEFDRSKGWDEARQIRFSKKLLEIISKHKPIGIVMGGSVDDYLHHFVDDNTPKKWKDGLYKFCICVVMDQIAEVMSAYFPEEKVTVYYDRGKFSGMADKAFRSMKDDPRNADVSKYFVTMAPMGWEDCIPLQPADLLAFEGLKRVDGSLNGDDAIRKSLQALLGKVDIAIGHFTRKSFGKLIDDKIDRLMSITGGAQKNDEDEFGIIN